MTAWANNFNGIASGTTPTSGNSGGVSGTAFTVAASPSGGSLTAQTVAAYEGATGLRIVWPATSASGYVAWTITGGTAGTRISGSFWFQFSANPTATDIIHIDTGASSVRLTTTGQIGIYDTAGIQKAVTAAVTPGTWLFIQHASTVGTTTSNGRIELRVTKADGTNLVSYDSANTANTGTSTLSTLYYGHSSAVANGGYTAYYDLLAVDNTLTGGTFPGSPAQMPAFTGGVKVWTGSAWAIKPVKVWTGSAWVVKPVKRWNGSAWVLTP